ncbi:ribonuclease P protein component [Xanthobacter agilis]|uniref:ribonuclease P protein component n=1 Tax=Xanthobacter agilis TaxID=47492 RepID=UPI0037276198
MPIVDQLRKRRDFLAAAKAERAGVSAFLLQGRNRGDEGDIRIGFTVTKKTGNAVVRNRIRRRLREVVRQVLPEAGRLGYDYVLVAREQALAAPFSSLLSDLGRALRKLHDPARPPRQGAPRRPSPASAGGAPVAAATDRRGDDPADAAGSHAPSRSAGPRKGRGAGFGRDDASATSGKATRAGARRDDLAAGQASASHGETQISSDPLAPSADGGHSA